MRIEGRHYRTIWLDADGATVVVIDQTRLPFEFARYELRTLEQTADAIERMIVRGAPLIGVTAAYGIALAMTADGADASLEAAAARLGRTRPTAVNLHWALARMARVLRAVPAGERAGHAYHEAQAIADEDVACCAAIGRHGLGVLRDIAARRGGGPVRVLTHCNAGWLATVDWGTALAPVYAAHEAGMPLHVYVDETRPRNQGASLTAFELGAHGVPHTVIVDNAGGHLMQDGKVDLCIVGTDRTAANGDVANKIGTYLKALAARDTGVPFYVGLPHSTIDWSLSEGVGRIRIEERDAGEVTQVTGRLPDGTLATVAVNAPGSRAANPSFDVTPARLVTAFITERGVCPASREGLLSLYPERAARACEAMPG